VTIEKAFQENEFISIAFAWEDICPYCNKTSRALDEEYSFEGIKEMFKSFSDEYEVYGLDDEVEEVEPGKYVFVKTSELQEKCPICAFLYS